MCLRPYATLVNILLIFLAQPLSAARADTGAMDIPAVVEKARQVAAHAHSVPLQEVELIKLQETVWPDTCLGIPSPELCARGETPGYRVIFKIGDKEFEYHTDRVEGIRSVESGRLQE